MPSKPSALFPPPSSTSTSSPPTRTSGCSARVPPEFFMRASPSRNACVRLPLAGTTSIVQIMSHRRQIPPPLAPFLQHRHGAAARSGIDVAVCGVRIPIPVAGCMTRIFTQCVLLGFSHTKYLRNLDTTDSAIVVLVLDFLHVLF